ncbi:cell division protein FtsA, partial [Candidatus Gottesmanbacteria bacterium]|nr:cell division protein FtsA [Candidatus Gottesmanbacteria bacterium]
MARDRTISSIDIGSSKVTTLIASMGEEETVNILGVSTVHSRGLRKGQVVNIEDATASISQSLEAAERMAGTTVGSAFVSIGGNHITSLNSHGVVAVAEPEKEITPQDVVRVIDAAKAVQLPS